MQPIDLDVLVNKVREVAAEHPDVVYDSQCVYYVHYTLPEERRPGCLIGHAFSRMGIGPDTENFLDADDNQQTINALLVESGTVTNFQVISDPRALWLTRVQNLQDAEKSWGEAVATADREPML